MKTFETLERRMAWVEKRKTRSTQVDETEFHKDSETDKSESMPHFMRLLHMYQSSATIHGIAQINGGNMYLYRGYIWLFMLVSMSTAATYFIAQQISYHLSYPIDTNIIKHFHGDNMIFPRVTICSTNQHHGNRLPENILTKHVVLNTPYYNMNTFGLIKIKKRPDFSNMSDVSGEELLNAARYAEHGLEDILLHCIWRAKLIPCKELFQPYVTWQGMCFAFNRNRTHPLRVSEPVPWDGLTLIIDGSQNNLTSSPGSGIMVMLKHPMIETHPLFGMWTVRPGVYAQMRCSVEVTKALPKPYQAIGSTSCVDTKSPQFVNPSLRFQNSSYDIRACLFDCQVSLIVNACGCYHYNDPAVYDDRINKTLPLCTAKQIISCYFPQLNSYDSLVDNSHGDLQRLKCSHCPIPCDMLEYVGSMTYMDVTSHFLSDLSTSLNVSDHRNYARNKIVMNLYMDTFVRQELRQMPASNLWDVFASMGGLLGLFIGASVLSLVEMTELLILLLLRMIGKFLSRLFNPRRQKKMWEQQQQQEREQQPEQQQEHDA